jgi:parvulin-like peptidyl-prolyl isomerase
VESAYGLHLVLVSERTTPAQPALADVRPLVVRELLAEVQRNRLQELYKALLAKYTVTLLELPEEKTQARAARAERGAR